MTKKRLGLIVGLAGGLVLVGALLKDGWGVEGPRVSQEAQPLKPKERREQHLLPLRTQEREVQLPERPPGETPRFLVLGKNQQIKLELDKLKLKRVFDDGTTQYTYEDGTVVTILSNGEVLLLPEEI